VSQLVKQDREERNLKVKLACNLQVYRKMADEEFLNQNFKITKETKCSNCFKMISLAPFTYEPDKEQVKHTGNCLSLSTKKW